MNGVSRRDFLKGTAAGALSLAAGGLLAACSSDSAAGADTTAAPAESVPENTSSSEVAQADQNTGADDSRTWNGLYDVVIIGMGFAGQAAAITAADEGAKVLILEKGPNGLDGGNSRYCHQSALGVYDGMTEQAKTYYRSLRRGFNHPEDAVIDAFVDELALNWSWFESLGASPVDYSTFTGVQYVGEHPEFEGYDSVYCMTLTEELGTGKMFKFLKEQIANHSDSIDLWYSAAATDLIQDPSTKAVIGVTANVSGTVVNIRAKNGVVISSGGYENNKQMVQDYAGIPEAYPIASHFNTGDGILMAARVGAQLSGMSNIMSYVNCLYDDGVTAEWDSGSRIATSHYDKSLIYVGGNGTRFTNEYFKSRHGWMPWHGDYIHQQIPVPAWCVFDEKARQDTFFSKTMNNGCEEALASGRIVTANTLEELAEQIGVPAENLTATVERYNRFCEEGVDYEFGRAANSLVAIDGTGPYYAFRMVQSVLNTQCGPRRNERAEIIDNNGDPIPHLYGAGECGELYTTLYQGGGNVGGCMAFGRIAGRNAAAAKSDSQPASNLVIDTFTPAVEEPAYEAGENQYIGIAEGHAGNLVLRVTMDGDTIAEVETLHSYETPNIGGKAVTRLSEAVVGLTRNDIDGIDGMTYATVSSNAFKEAVKNALA